MLYLVLIEFFLVVSIEWSTVSAQDFTFDQTATGPSVTCRGGNATFTCRIVNVGGFLQSNQWLFSNRSLIMAGTPNHMFSRNPMGLVTDLVVSNVDASTTYICTTFGAPSDFDSTAPLTVAGPPSAITISNSTGDICTTTISGVSWSPSTGDPVCGPVSHNVMISPSDDRMMMMRITDTSYNFTGLTPGTDYTVSVAGMNMAGVGQSDMMTFLVPTVTEAVPIAVTDLKENGIGLDMITVRWVAAIDSRYCEGLLYYQVIISSDDDLDINPNTLNKTTTTATFRNLMNNTRYTITVAAVNRGGTGMVTMTTVTTLAERSDDDSNDGGSSSSTGAIVGGVVGGIVAAVVITIIIIILVYVCVIKKELTDDKENLRSPTGTGVSHTASVKPASSAEPPVLYDAPDQSSIVPHQKAATGEEYAVSSKATGKPKKQQKQQPMDEYAQIDKSKKKQPQLNYADLAELPTGNKPIPAAPTATYAQVA